jgi:glycerol-3-phosphate dehydrogenase (NAD(P)+)
VGTTVAAPACNADHAVGPPSRAGRRIAVHHRNGEYWRFDLPEQLATVAARGVGDADVLVRAPSHGMRATLRQLAEYVRPWVPVVSLAKGWRRSNLRMTEVIEQELATRWAC